MRWMTWWGGARKQSSCLVFDFEGLKPGTFNTGWTGFNLHRPNVAGRFCQAPPGSSPLVTTPSYSTLYAISCMRVVRARGQGRVHDDDNIG